ncbi:TPA: bifunctional phosphopantothenoylcysteine decarboxylase/phosphopantothenate--cysteine ligase CoaBC [Candidatus Gracilibacteria bacterium]|nr:bifunctional phosphopantothenoylcysteine decarboxylase/phosphopantothenate--cysteine ligase CoaBC [Candidatus Gracilibacteria bacterium]
MKNSKKIILAITGSIAAVKTYDAIRMFQNDGYDVQCVVSNGGENFISRLALESLSGYPVLGPDIFSFPNFENKELTIQNYNKKNSSEIFAHIECTKNIEAVVVLPASANFLADFSQGRATNFLSSMMLANTKPVVLCPAMNSHMWNNSAVQNNIKIIKILYANTQNSNNLEIVEPQKSGILACGDEGVGKLALLENIKLYLEKLLTKNYHKNNIHNKTVVINLGGTQEKIDPVRFIGNFSSGETGKIIAEQCFILGAKKVICIVGNVSVCFQHLEEIENFEIIYLANNSAQEMLAATEKYVKEADIVIFTAAVADFTPKNYLDIKIKKVKKVKKIHSDDNLATHLMLELQETIDIAKYSTEQYKNNIYNKKIFIGFALETEKNIEKYKQIIQKKCEDKNLDYVLGNTPQNFSQNKNSQNFNYLVYSKKTQNFTESSEFLDKKTFFKEFLKYIPCNS